MKNYLLLFILIICFNAQAQIKHSTVKKQAKKQSVNLQEAIKNQQWFLSLESIPNIVEEHFGNYEEVKLKNKMTKLAQNIPAPNPSNKTAGATPTIGKSFIGTQLKSWTPSDNAIAISNDGWIVSAVNWGMEVYDTDGNAIISSTDWNTFFFNDPDLNLGKFDPRVLYDPYNDRFIICLLHGPLSTTRSKIILAFSQTNNPTQGWNIYEIDGNPLNNNSWTDYPSMAVNENELFINCNLFEPAPNYLYRGTYIQQIDLDSVYAGNAMQYMTWSGFDSTKYITLKPVMEGQGNAPADNQMHFVMMHPAQDTVMHRVTITDTMNAPGVTIDSATYSLPAYSACADAYIKNPDTGNLDSLSTGASWIHQCFQLDDKILFTFSGNVNGWCGIHLGTLDLTTGIADYTSYSQAGTDLAYPAIASIGYNTNDKNTAMMYCKADTATLPEVGVITIDDAGNWSSPQVVKAGETVVDILGNQTERWGDYSDMQRKYNAVTPEAWLFGAYGANTFPRPNSYGNWIAQIISSDEPLAINDVHSPVYKDIALYPNPTVNIFYVDFEIKKESKVHIRLIDMSGRLVKSLYNETLPPSRNKFSFNRNALSSGQYFVEIIIDKARVTKKLVVVE